MIAVYSDGFTRDLDDLLDFIDSRNPMRAHSFVEEIRTLCGETLASSPRMGSPRLKLGKQVRGFHSKRHNRTVLYRVDDDAGQIIFLRLVYDQDIKPEDFTE